MKNHHYLTGRLLVTGIMAILFIFVTKPGKGQDTTAAKKETGTTIKLKIVKEKDGERKVIDTVIVTDPAMEEDQIKELMGDLEGDMKTLSMEMDDMEFDIQMDLPELEGFDSITDGKSKVIVINKGGRKAHVERKRIPRGTYRYNYNYDCPRILNWEEAVNGWSGCCDMQFPGSNVFKLQGSSKGTLNDLIGDIPMERVKSYSIKERKNGKRIIIDLEDGPLVEKQDQVIIMREGYPLQMRHRAPEQKVKVIVETDDVKAPAPPSQPESPGSPAAPAPAKTKSTETKTVEKPKI